MTQEPAIETIQIVGNNPLPLIYADRIINFGFGPVVSRLTLAMEVGPNTFAPSGSLVIPTTALLDALDHIQKHLHDNPESKELVSQGLEAIKEQFSKL